MQVQAKIAGVSASSNSKPASGELARVTDHHRAHAAATQRIAIIRAKPAGRSRTLRSNSTAVNAITRDPYRYQTLVTCDLPGR